MTSQGQLIYQRHQCGQAWQQQTNVDPQLLKILKAALADAQAASMSQQPILSRATLVPICYGDQQTSVDYFQARKLPGYAQIMQIMDIHLQTFRSAAQNS